MKRNQVIILWVIVILIVWLIIRDKVKFGSDTTTTTTTEKTTTSITSYRGTSTHSGNGTATSFQIPHLLGRKPSFVQITAVSPDAADFKNVQYDELLITVFYEVAPPAGNSNITYNWFATL